MDKLELLITELNMRHAKFAKENDDESISPIIKYKSDLRKFLSYKDINYDTIENFMIDDLMGNIISNLEIDVLDESLEYIKNTDKFIHKGILDVDLIYPANIHGRGYENVNIRKILFIIEDNMLITAYQELGLVSIFNMEDKFTTHIRVNDNLSNSLHTITLVPIVLLRLAYMISNDDRNRIVENKKVIGKSKGKKGKKNNGKLIYKNTYSVNLNENKIYDYGKDYIPSKKYKRHTESWNVRGFWRHYKSGKKVWIKPSVRGNKNTKPKNQKYTL